MNYHRGNLPQDLQKYALALITVKGVAGLNLRELAAECNVSSTAVYRHYASKEHLLATLAESGFRQLITVMAEAEKNECNKKEKLRAIGMAYILFAQNHKIYFQLMFGTYIDKAKFSTLAELSLKAYQVLYTQIEQGIRDGFMRGKTENLAHTAWATVHGTAILLNDQQFQNQSLVEKNNENIARTILMTLEQGLFLN
jgi:AcrR family transcriptional regulator